MGDRLPIGPQKKASDGSWRGRRPERLRWLVLLLGLVLGLGCAAAPPEHENLNVILVSLDTLRADHLSLYGYDRKTSPHLDRIARDSVVFERAISQASSTTPSHRSLFRSKYPAAGKRGAPPLALILKNAGYETAGFTGGGKVAAAFGFGLGFDTYLEASRGSKSFQEIFPKLVRWLERPRQGNFFVFLHSYDIHHPYLAPPELMNFFCPAGGCSLDGKSSGTLLNQIRGIQGQQDFAGKVELTDVQRSEIEALYDGGILHADTFLGKLRRVLEKQGLWDRTLLVFLADHGEEFWDHGSVLHSHTLYQELLHVPLVIRFPDGRFGGRRIAAPVRLLDVAPTLLEVLGLPEESRHQGESLLPLIRNGGGPGRLCASQMGDLRSFLLWPQKLIAHRKTGAIERYDLEKDPGETTDLAVGASDEALREYRRLASRIEPLSRASVLDLDEVPDDPRLREQLRALGYLD